MTSDLQLMMSMKVSLSKDVVGFNPITVNDSTIVLTLAGVNLAVWNDAYIAKLTLATGVSTTADMQNWVDLIGTTGKSFNKVFGIGLTCQPLVPASPACVLEVSPGAANPLQWFFRGAAEGLRLVPGEVMMLLRPPTDITGFVVDATHKTLKFANSGADSLVATVIVLGGHP